MDSFNKNIIGIANPVNPKTATGQQRIPVLFD